MTLRIILSLSLLLFLAWPGAAQVEPDAGSEAGAAPDDGGADEMGAEAVAALAVTVARPREEAWAVSVPASGWLEPWAEASIAVEASGARITEILVDVGQQVSEGEVLARLSDASARADLRRQEAMVAQARSAAEQARADAERARSLQGSGAVTEQSVIEASSAEAQAEATLAAEEAALEAAQIQVDQMEVRAVDDGVISLVSAELGAVAMGGTELFRLIRQGRVEWQAEVSPRFLHEMREGLAAVLEGPTHGIEGAVRLVSPTVDQDTGRIIVYVALPQDVDGVRPRAGLFASGRIEVDKRPALTVPQSAIVLRDGYTYVYAVEADSTVTRVKVETGRRQDDRVEIASGLDALARVVAEGGAFLSDGAAVRIVEGDGTTAAAPEARAPGDEAPGDEDPCMGLPPTAAPPDPAVTAARSAPASAADAATRRSVDPAPVCVLPIQPEARSGSPDAALDAARDSGPSRPEARRDGPSDGADPEVLP